MCQFTVVKVTRQLYLTEYTMTAIWLKKISREDPKGDF